MRYLEDLLNNSTIGTASGVTYADDLHRKVAVFDAVTDKITYAVGYSSTAIGWIPKQGTIGLWLKATDNGYILSSVGTGTKVAGDIRLQLLAGKLVWSVWDADEQHTIIGSTTIVNSGKYHWVAVSFGVGGMHLWVDGIEEGAFGASGDSTQTRNSLAVTLGTFASESASFIGRASDLKVSDVESDMTIIRGEDGAMAMRIHSYGVNPRYDFDFEYARNQIWNSLKTRVISSEAINISKQHGDFFTGRLLLENSDGLLTIENTASAYNLNGAEYDPLLDEARKVRIRQGIYCLPCASRGIAPTSTPAPTTGALASLTDCLYGSEADAGDANWVQWSLGSAATIVLKIDLGSAKNVSCGMLSFLSKSTGVKLPSTVQFAYSTDDATYTNCTPLAFDMSEYGDTTVGQRYLAWFTDLEKSARYIRATITNISASNTVAIDEFAVYAGATAESCLIETLTGYLGESIDAENGEATVSLEFLDVRKKENDNRLIELTEKYVNKRPEEIIYDLLTNTKYWTGSAGAYDAPVMASEIGWAEADDLSSFPLTKWQGQQGTIQDYIDQLCKCIGWVYDCDGDGKRQFWEPEYYRSTPSTFLNLFGQRWGMRGTVKRHKTGNDIRNYINVTAKEAKIGKVTGIIVQHAASIAKYGKRYGRVTEPLVTTADLQQRLGKSLLRDFAYARDAITVDAKGDFDLDRPDRIISFHEPIRAYLDKASLWTIQSYDTEMRTNGRGNYLGHITSKQHVSAPPVTVVGPNVSYPHAPIAFVTTDGQAVVSWGANTESNVTGYYVYLATGDTPASWTWTKRPKVTSAEDTITGLAVGNYWVYVTAVNADGTESPPSLPLHLVVDGENESWSYPDLQWGLEITAGAPLRQKKGDVVQELDVTDFGLFDLVSASAVVTLLGPAANTTPTNTREVAEVVPSGVSGHSYLYVRMPFDLFSAGDAPYWRVKLHSIKIAGVDYFAGVAIESANGYSATTWPS
jgi:hypothetical protein